MARAILPVNLYTEWYWKNDLHNLLHFIGLRSDSHAQYEIRVFSDAMAKSVKEVAPFAWEAYQDYAVGGLRFSKIEQNILEKKANSLSNGNDIKLSSFGSFLIKRKKSRIGRNPKTKIEAVISERNVVIFRPSMQLKNKINTD